MRAGFNRLEKLPYKESDAMGTQIRTEVFIRAITRELYFNFKYNEINLNYLPLNL